MLKSLVLAVLAPIVCADSLQRRQTTACNNSPDLCNKPYGTITHLGAHDSPFVTDRSSNETSANQYFNSTQQLSAGVRLLSAQVHASDGAYHLCHSSCLLYDAGLLSDWLAGIKGWMDQNTNEVVTVLLVNSDDASAAELGSEFQTSGITTYAYTPAAANTAIAPSEWPTLQELINQNTRLMTFVASLSDNTGAAYLMDEFTYIFENNYEVTSMTNFTCNPSRPSDLSDIPSALSSGRLPFMNHFLDTVEGFSIETPDLDNIATTNSPSTTTTGALGNSAQQCKQQYSGQQPTFILVDFFDAGPAIDVVDSLNNVTNAQGRTVLTEADSEAAASSSSSGSSTGDSSSTSGVRGRRTVFEEAGNAIWGLIGVVAFMVTFM